MLTKTQIKVLKAAISLSNNGNAVISWYEVARKLDLYPNIIFKAVKILVQKELLEYVYDTEEHIPQGFILTSYSLNLKEYLWMKFREFLISNLIAILALIVAVIALFLPV